MHFGNVFFLRRDPLSFLISTAYFSFLLIGLGPADALFQKPFYENMKSALSPGGIVCTQAECIWLHLNVIGPMMKFCRELFGSGMQNSLFGELFDGVNESGRKAFHISYYSILVCCKNGFSLFLSLVFLSSLDRCLLIFLHFLVAEYAFTTIPTYPSGQIGFLVCRKKSEDEEDTIHSCSKPNREVPDSLLEDLRYYSREVHEASFVLPRFAQKALAIEVTDADR